MPHVLRIWKNLYLKLVEIMTLGIFFLFLAIFKVSCWPWMEQPSLLLEYNPVRRFRITCFWSFNASDTLYVSEIGIKVSTNCDFYIYRLTDPGRRHTRGAVSPRGRHLGGGERREERRHRPPTRATRDTSRPQLSGKRSIIHRTATPSKREEMPVRECLQLCGED